MMSCRSVLAMTAGLLGAAVTFVVIVRHNGEVQRREFHTLEMERFSDTVTGMELEGVVYLYDPYFAGEKLRLFRGNKRIREVYIDGGELDGALAELAFLPHLETLVLSGVSVSAHDLANVRGKASLKEVVLVRCRHPAGALRIFHTLPQLKMLVISLDDLFLLPRERREIIQILSSFDGLVTLRMRGFTTAEVESVKNQLEEVDVADIETPHAYVTIHGSYVDFD